ncbi:MAG: hypothetical protein Roseis3KO_54490 [Roseivirga sp.]
MSEDIFGILKVREGDFLAGFGVLTGVGAGVLTSAAGLAGGLSTVGS